MEAEFEELCAEIIELKKTLEKKEGEIAQQNELIETITR